MCFTAIMKYTTKTSLVIATREFLLSDVDSIYKQVNFWCSYFVVNGCTQYLKESTTTTTTVAYLHRNLVHFRCDNLSPSRRYFRSGLFGICDVSCFGASLHDCMRVRQRGGACVSRRPGAERSGSSWTLADRLLWRRARLCVVIRGLFCSDSANTTPSSSPIRYIPNSPRPPMFQSTDGTSKHRLSPFTSALPLVGGVA